MAAARRVGVGELVDQHELGATREDGVEIHFLEDPALVVDRLARNDLKAGELGLGLGAAVRFHDADHDIHALGLATLGGDQHRVGLADAGRGAKEDLELAARFLLRRLQQRVGRRACLVRREQASRLNDVTAA